MAEELDERFGKMAPVSLTDEMTDSYTRFALSVITSRALPDVRDGLKPSQRRILTAMHDENLVPERPHSKCAAIVGETMKTYHPHGDASIYDALVRMGQDFNARYPLVDPQGNFGSVDGDPAGAARYTEARLSQVAMAMLADIDMETVDFRPTYDERNQEPTVLPGMFPNLVCNGASGIAVAYATEIPPHNLSEVIDGLTAMLDNPEIDIDGLMKHIKGPDFPTAGLILGMKGIREYFHTGRGSVTMQARAIIEPMERGNRQAIIVTELPYQIGKTALIKQIAKLIEANKLEGISDLRDESDRKGMRMVIELKRDANPNVVLNNLYKHTNLRTTFAANMIVLVPSGDALVPRQLNIKQLLELFLVHRRDVITRRTRFLLRKAEEREHIVEGLLKAINIIDEIIALVRASANRSEARAGLMSTFGFSERQAEAILAMQLGQLTRLSRIELEKEMDGLLKEIADYNDILSSEERKSEVIKQELRTLKRNMGDERRTRIVPNEADDIEMEDLIAQEDMTITITRDGYIKRLPVDTYRLQRRGGRGVVALTKKEEDTVKDLFVATTHHILFCFTNTGKVYRTKAYQVPIASRTARGTPIVNLVPLQPGEAITAIIPVAGFDVGGYLVMCTKHGTIKKTELKEFDTVYKTLGLNAINLTEGDELLWVLWTDGNKDILVATREGKALRFSETDVRPMGRNAAGVSAIKLRKGDRIECLAVLDTDDKRDLLVVSEKGLGKRTALTEYRCQGRNTQGVMTLQITERNGCVIGVLVVDNDDEIMCITKQGVLIRMLVEKIRETGRNAQGVKVVNLDEGDHVVAVTKVVREAGEQPEAEQADEAEDIEINPDDELEDDQDQEPEEQS